MAYTTINKSTDYFNTKLWTGTGSNGNAISGVGFAPDLVWVKNRSGTYDHVLFDRVRGDNKHVESNNNSAEENEANTLAFGSDGYSVGTNTLNNSGSNIVGWNWKANGAGSANTDGSISSTVSANTTSGFSIVKYTGTGSNATVGHGLGVAPSMIIFKRLVGSGWNWTVYHKSLGNNYFMSLNLTNAKSNTSSSTYFQDTTPTSSVFSIGDSGHLNGDDIIAYCFAEKQGYSKFGSYTGNGNADGAFVYTGFKPAFAIIKDTAARSWIMVDNKRNTFNVVNNRLFPDASDAQNTGVDALDFLSNGFKIRSDNSSVNVSGNTYIYMAFAEAPLVGSNNVPCTAR